MKNKFLRTSLLLFLGLSLTAPIVTSCSNDDNQDSAVSIIQHGELETDAKHPFSIDPKINVKGAVFKWYLDDNLISNDPILNYQIDEPGNYIITLKNTTPTFTEIHSYKVKVQKGLDFNYITLDLSTFDLSDGIEAQGGKIWNKTYTDKEFLTHQIFTFSHTSEYPQSWDGFTISNVKDNTTEHSNWVENQWGNIAKGGIKGEGTPFLIGFWGYYMKDWIATEGVFEEEKYSNWIKIGDAKDTYKAVSIYLTNHPWPISNILEGGYPASPFKKGDYFSVNIYGVDKDNKVKPNVIEHVLADYRGENLTISKEWNKIDLSSLGEVSYIFFQVQTTDSGQYGPNTAAYFCLDGLTVDKQVIQ